MTEIRRHARSGFTLIELMIAIAIAAILAFVIGPNIMTNLAKAERSKAESTLLALKGAITQYRLAVGKWPSRLKDLVQPPTDERDKAKWPGNLLDKKEIPEDPWDNNYVYKVNPAGAENPYELYSYGKNGKGAPQGEWISVWKL
jgi:general secretion pathway protein G